jgi:hypothetical protein
MARASSEISFHKFFTGRRILNTVSRLSAACNVFILAIRRSGLSPPIIHTIRRYPLHFAAVQWAVEVAHQPRRVSCTMAMTNDPPAVVLGLET